MLEAVLGSKPIGMVLDQAFLDEIFALVWDILESLMVKVEFTLYDVLNNLRLRAPWERNFSREHNVQNYSHWPNIYFHVIFLEKYLWSNVVRWSTHCVHGGLLRKIFGKPEINHFNACQIPLFVKHEILRLDVSMRDLFRVEIIQCWKKLLHNKSSVLLRQIFFLDDVMEKFSTLAEL